jgi:flagellar hook assembly protein FlgD
MRQSNVRNAPNPFNPTTSVVFDLPVRSRTRVEILDVRGRLRRVLADGILSAGRHRVAWDGTYEDGGAAPSGVYLVRLRTDREEETHKMVLVR